MVEKEKHIIRGYVESHTHFYGQIKHALLLSNIDNLRFDLWQER